MDSRMIPGLTIKSKKYRIFQNVKDYFNIYHAKGRDPYSSLVKKMSAFLYFELTKLSQEETALIIDLSERSTIPYYNRIYRDAYTEQSSDNNNFYCCLYLNLKAKITNKKHLSINELLTECITNSPATALDKNDAIMSINNGRGFINVENMCIKSFIIYFKKNNVSPAEMKIFLNLKPSTKIPHLSMYGVRDIIPSIEKTITEQIKLLKSK